MSEAAGRQPHFVAPLDQTPLEAVDRLDEAAPPTSLWAEAWHKLRRQPLFIVSAILVVFIAVVVAFPQWFSSISPMVQDGENCRLANSLAGPTSGHIFGYDKQGCDVFAQVVYGARPSFLVGVLTVAFTLIVGGALGAIAGYYGRWLDALVSRVSEIFYAVPLVLAAIVLLSGFRAQGGVGVFGVVLVLGAFGWPQMARITRGAVLAVRSADFVTAATALGVSRGRILIRHVLPNAAAAMIVTATVSLGTYIVAEATLSFLGVGLPRTLHSWGMQIGDAKNWLAQAPEVLFYPAAALAVTVLAFIMLGDAVRDALDPKVRG
ncbi:MAG: ABC transporter permease [Bifidobacteriaceae bacterium]|jgi:oligopeptide transport system permease protein|nr:ABC transporter permease [Bifidobacteriaceae bacterium]